MLLLVFPVSTGGTGDSPPVNEKPMMNMSRVDLGCVKLNGGLHYGDVGESLPLSAISSFSLLPPASEQ